MAWLISAPSMDAEQKLLEAASKVWALCLRHARDSLSVVIRRCRCPKAIDGISAGYGLHARKRRTLGYANPLRSSRRDGAAWL
jgi:hypothetical protein